MTEGLKIRMGNHLLAFEDCLALLGDEDVFVQYQESESYFEALLLLDTFLGSLDARSESSDLIIATKRSGFALMANEMFSARQDLDERRRLLNA